MAIQLSKTVLASVVFAISSFGLASTVQAAGSGGTHMEHVDWGFKGPFGTYDRPAMQRGYQVYREVCASCHALEHLAFRHLGDKGAPFYIEDYPNPNDNPDVKAFAKDWQVDDIDNETGDPITREGKPADKFPAIYPNAVAAAAANGGAVPPDLSLITMARNNGPDYVYSLLVGYHEAPHDFEVAPGTYYNTAFEGNLIKMSPPLSDGIVEYASVQKKADGHGDDHGEAETIAPPEATVEQMAKDVTEFLTWAGDPKMETRKKVGFGTFIYLFIFALLMYMSYKEVWRDVEH